MTADSSSVKSTHRSGARPRTAPLSAQELREAVAGMLGVTPQEVPDDAHLVHLGLGSLEMMRLVTRWRRQGVPADFAELTAAPTLAAWQRHLDAVWAARAPGVST
ncbi:phosphopantetheine-binding protein [Streptomyces sp. ST2-7A]|uniref:phosphopantetheine-binding protein n=1 Tax=Streptomyces sp. ST2-7A TaxID=2907214 RepID=UPI001F447D7A|nr:phosphopantetheine-binding protein [Streptomyces sp. ST2-7A]MCE7082328.1 phosphopantetheine-binding protein [Streptomyces sp. ST2-7A]